MVSPDHRGKSNSSDLAREWGMAVSQSLSPLNRELQLWKGYGFLPRVSAGSDKSLVSHTDQSRAQTP